jgi:hypothetical protein
MATNNTKAAAATTRANKKAEAEAKALEAARLTAIETAASALLSAFTDNALCKADDDKSKETYNNALNATKGKRETIFAYLAKLAATNNWATSLLKDAAAEALKRFLKANPTLKEGSQNNFKTAMLLAMHEKVRGNWDAAIALREQAWTYGDNKPEAEQHIRNRFASRYPMLMEGILPLFRDAKDGVPVNVESFNEACRDYLNGKPRNAAAAAARLKAIAAKIDEVYKYFPHDDIRSLRDATKRITTDFLKDAAKLRTEQNATAVGEAVRVAAGGTPAPEQIVTEDGAVKSAIDTTVTHTDPLLSQFAVMSREELEAMALVMARRKTA